MKTNPSKKSDPNHAVGNEISRIMASNRFIFGFMGISFAINLSLGPLFFLIGFGVLLGLIALGQAFDPPYQLLRVILRSGNLPPHLNQVSWLEKVWACIVMVFPALFLYLGVRGLQVGG